MQGQIDLWAELDNEIHVLDYKTGSSEYAEKAFDQLAVYTLALLQMKMIPAEKKIILSVVYPGEKLIKKKVFPNAEDFKRELPAAVAGIFF